MKKIFVILMAAMVFLASCSGEKLTYEENCDYGVKAMEKGDYTVAIGYFIEAAEEILKASYLENESEILLAGISEAETSGTVIPLAAGIVG